MAQSLFNMSSLFSGGLTQVGGGQSLNKKAAPVSGPMSYYGGNIAGPMSTSKGKAGPGSAPAVLGATIDISNIGQKQSGGGGGGGGQNNFTPTPPPTPEYGGDPDIDALFSGAFSDLDSQASQIGGQKSAYITQAQQAGEDQKQEFENRRKTGQQQLTEDETTARSQEANAMQQARQLFGELSQYNQSRFGSGNSAGQAAMELLGRSTQQGVGAITQQAGEIINKIKTAWRNLDDFVEENKLKITRDVQTKVDEITRWADDSIKQINSNRTMLESQKAQKRYEVLQNRTNFLNEVNRQQWEFGQQLAQWQAERQAALSSQAQSYTIDPITGEIITGMGEQMAANAPREGAVSTGPVAMLNGKPSVLSEQGNYGGSMRYKTLPTGEIVDQYTGQLVSPGQIPQGLRS